MLSQSCSLIFHDHEKKIQDNKELKESEILMRSVIMIIIKMIISVASISKDLLDTNKLI